MLFGLWRSHSYATVTKFLKEALADSLPKHRLFRLWSSPVQLNQEAIADPRWVQSNSSTTWHMYLCVWCATIRNMLENV